jgi:hypothetical protein
VKADTLKRRRTAGGILKVRIAAVDYDVACAQIRIELLYDSVYRRTRFHHEHYASRTLKRAHEFFDCGRTDHVFDSSGRALHESLRHAGRTVVHRYPVTVSGHIENQILAHHTQPNQTDICLHCFYLHC